MFGTPTIKFTVDFEPIVAMIPKEAVVARIYSDAVGANGFPYFWAVELGRRAILQIDLKKKAMRWTGAPGTIAAFGPERLANSVFARAVKATSAQNIRQKTIRQALGIASGWESQYNATRESMVALVNRVATLVTWLLAQNTPKRTQALSRSYRIDPAV